MGSGGKQVEEYVIDNELVGCSWNKAQERMA